MTDLSQLFLYLPGIIIFLVGSGQVRNRFLARRADFSADAAVIGCKHVVKKDKKGRETYNYYDVTVEYRNPKSGHKERLAVKSPVEYAQAQQVRIYQAKGGDRPVLAGYKEEFLFRPWVTMIGGALLILLALEQNRGHEVQAMACLSLIFIGAGINLTVDYIRLKRCGLQPLDAEITDIYTRQISRETKILKGAKYTYYPVVRYELNGQQNIRRCNINSSGRNTFQTGERLTLYYDPGSGAVLEKHARTGAAAAGVLLVLIGLLAGASILSVVL